MKAIKITVLLAASMLLCIADGYSQPQKASAQPPAQEAKADSAKDAQIQILKAEVQVMKDFTQHILATVYYALGTVVVVLIAMIGFGWYQNFRVFERDKEALRQSLLTTLREETTKGFDELQGKAAERFKAFDESMAGALKQTHQRLSDIHLSLETAVFHAAHAPKTPRTDFMVFYEQINRSIGHVSQGVLEQALSRVLDHVQTSSRIDPPTRTSLLKLAGRVSEQHAAFGERLRELLAGKPE